MAGHLSSLGRNVRSCTGGWHDFVACLSLVSHDSAIAHRSVVTTQPTQTDLIASKHASRRTLPILPQEYLRFGFQFLTKKRVNGDRQTSAKAKTR